MSWWPWSDKPGEKASSRSTMRDAMNRLRSIILKYGGTIEDVEMGTTSSGDPFQDKVNGFIRQVKSCRDLIVERNKNQRDSLGSAADLAMDSHEINKMLSELKKELEQIQELVQRDEEKLRKANKKNKDAALIASLEASHKEKSISYQNCQNALESLRELNSQRMMSDKEADKQGRIGTGLPKGFRSQIDVLKQNRKNRRITIAGADGDDTQGQGSLAKDSETAEEHAALQKKQQEQDACLDQLANVLGEITEGAKKIGQELEMQSKMLDGQATKVDTLTDKIGNLNKGLTDLLKKQKPQAMTMYCVGCLLILAIVGFFVTEFGLA